MSGSFPEFLFLDIDGVLHSTVAGDSELLSQLPILETWLLLRQQVSVVISSSWRHSHSLEQLQELFVPELRPRIVGATNVYWRWTFEATGEVPLTTPYEREREVLRWLSDSDALGRPWVALDDEVGQFGRTKDHVVACDPVTGLVAAQLAELDLVVDCQRIQMAGVGAEGS
jgi:Swiss Army Knife RNA repair-like protein